LNLGWRVMETVLETLVQFFFPSTKSFGSETSAAPPRRPNPWVGWREEGTTIAVQSQTREVPLSPARPPGSPPSSLLESSPWPSDASGANK
jgi:hypothetical protein